MSFRWSTAVVHLSTVYTWYSRIKHEHLERGVGTNCSFADTNKRKWKVASLLPLFLLHSFCNSLSLHSKSISLPGTKRTLNVSEDFSVFFRPCTGSQWLWLCSYLPMFWGQPGPLETKTCFGEVWQHFYWHLHYGILVRKKCVFIPFLTKHTIYLQTVIFVMVLYHFVKSPPWLSLNLLVNFTAGGTSSQVAKIFKTFYCSL